MIETGSKVKVHYTGKLENDNVFDTSKERDPLEVTIGQGQLIPGFENGLMGMNVGDKKTIEIEPEQAYGPVREELVSEVPKTNLPEGVQVGNMLQAQTEQGPINVRVAELGDTTAKVDANHPLAGKKLIFDLEVIEIA